MTISTLPLRPQAVLVGVQLPGVSERDHAADLAELGRLVHTLGFEVVATMSQRRDSLASGTVLGEGKLRELAALTGGARRRAERRHGTQVEGTRPLHRSG